MDRFHPDGDQVAPRVARGASIEEAVAAARRDNLVAAVEDFRNTGDRDILSDILIALLRK